MANEGRDIVLFLTRGKIYLYAGSAVMSMSFPEGAVRDVDVVNQESLTKSVTSFIQTNNLTPAQIFFVLAESACFSKDFAVNSQLSVPALEAEIQDFINSIPFESVVSKVYKTATVERAVASNQELIDIIMDVFTAKGFGLTALVPANIYSKYAGEDELTSDFARTILGDKEKAVSGSLVGASTQSDGHEISTTKASGEPSKLRLYILVGVFVAGLIFLGVILLMRG